MSEETKCRICGRPLEAEPYVTLGVGKICLAQLAEGMPDAQQQGDTDIINPYDGGDFFIERRRHGGITTNVRRTVYRHSPTGFNYGYTGSGPADFALNLLLMVTDEKTAYQYYHLFKVKFLCEKTNRLDIPLATVIAFLNEVKQKSL